MREIPESPPVLRLVDISTKTEGDFPLRTGIQWSLDGKNVPGEKVVRHKGVFDATLTVKFGTVVKVELKTPKGAKE